MVSESCCIPQYDLINAWVASASKSCIPPTPPPDDDSKPRPAPLKRKRAMSLPTNTPASNSYRSNSPKRRRADDTDNVQPDQSASQLGSETPLTLNEINTFSPPASRVSSSQKRSSSPTRETPIILRSAYPPVLVESLNGLKEAPPEHIERLGNRLAEGIDFGFIPQGLLHVIKTDSEVGHQTTKPADFDRSDSRSAEELSTIWKEAKKIFLNARDCKDGGRDENAWCDDVVRPLVHLAMELDGSDRWWFQSVQTQSINPRYLPTLPAYSLVDSGRRKHMDRKTDYVLSYSHRHPDISALYKRLDAVNNREIGHTLDAFTKRTALFSGFEVKPASGDHTEAELQMSIWIAASLRKKQELAQITQTPFEPMKMVEPALTIVGHEHSIYYAYPREDLVTAHGNQGAQVGHNSGAIANHFYVPAERPETPPQPSCSMPFRRDPDFVDRGTLLDQIRQRCATPASRVALSQLAIEHCYRTAEQSPDTWVFWAHASNTARLEQSFREIADQVKVRGQKDPQADVFKLVHDWLRDAKNGRWLLVLDNADDAAVLSPTDGGSGLSAASIERAAMQVAEDSDVILIKPMYDAAAHALLRKKLGDVDEEDGSIATLAITLDHMPLALYLEEYRQSDRRKTSLLNQKAGHLRRDAAASNSVLLTWQISFDHIRKTRQSAAGLLSLMSFFDRQGIQEALLHRQSSAADDGFEEDVLALRDYSFITVTRDADTFEMHSLVQLATRTWLENEGQLDKWREQFISNLCAELPTGEHENWKKCEALFPHAQAALAQQPKSRVTKEAGAITVQGGMVRVATGKSRRGRADGNDIDGGQD
ncbi:hypothetical protein A1F96_08973 [Pyrenophora tritici-repentis]|nr:hypothetical protein Alg215_10461 [Pyrenophora tritici-repentis]PZD24855.1 hypothetical protein A1F96_08973 [Pyrenophora tritici-repentis]